MLESVAPPAGLTPRQLDAVLHRGSNVLVEAVPGSGKTRVIVARCGALLAEGVAASAILLLTFSRRAVGELRTRLLLALGDAAMPEIRTFHGFAARLLAETGSAGRSRRLLSEPAERALFEYVVSSTRLSSLPAGIGRSVHFRDIASVRVDEIRRSSPDAAVKLRKQATPRLTDLLDLERAQHQVRDRLGVADYDDLVARSVALASIPASAVENVLHDRYRHVLVDEFQDTDPLQLALLRQLNAEIFAVADAAQAIYGFRGAARDALARARSDLSMTTLPLDQSFRCPANICDVARSVWPSPPSLHSRVAAVAEIDYRRAVSSQDEAMFLAESIAEAIEGGIPEHQIAVLVRSAEPMARPVERALRGRGIAVARQGGENVRDDLAVDAMCAALKALAEPADPAGWVELFGHPVFGISPLPLRIALDATPPRSVAQACRLVGLLDTRARVSGSQIASAVRSAHEHWEAGDAVRAARHFAAGADVLGFVIERDESSAQNSARCIASFLAGLADVADIRSRVGADASSAAVFAAFLTGSDSWRAGSAPIDDEPGVRILTIHAAKGLEFDFVAIADAVDNRFPQPWRADELLTEAELATARECGVDLGTRPDEHIAEERALWYVAATRAKKKLLITWSELDLDGSPQRPSCFMPLDARMRAAWQPSFRGLLEYAVATLPDPQPLMPTRLTHPLATSKIETWFNCRRKFYYSALLRIESDRRGLKAKLGTLVHRTIQEFHASVHDFRNVEDGAHTGWVRTLRKLAQAIVTSGEAFAAFGSALETDAAMRAASRIFDRYARELETSARVREGGFEVIGSEERVTFAVDGVSFVGTIDRIDRFGDGTLALVDVKTGSFKKEKAMAQAFPKLAAAAAADALWLKAPVPANPQLALYRHAKSATQTLEYLYLEARPKSADFIDAAYADRVDVTAGADALAALDGVLSTTFFGPWTSGVLTSLDPTRYARTCRSCDFVTVCPGYLEDDD